MGGAQYTVCRGAAVGSLDEQTERVALQRVVRCRMRLGLQAATLPAEWRPPAGAGEPVGVSQRLHEVGLAIDPQERPLAHVAGGRRQDAGRVHIAGVAHEDGALPYPSLPCSALSASSPRDERERERQKQTAAWLRRPEPLVASPAVVFRASQRDRARPARRRGRKRSLCPRHRRRLLYPSAVYCEALAAVAGDGPTFAVVAALGVAFGAAFGRATGASVVNLVSDASLRTSSR